jgi:REP element-mobilizing transposase RayT
VGRRLRYFPDRPLVEVTTRTLQGRFLLRPSPGLREIFVGILARAAALYEVEVHAFVCLSNHWHALLTPKDARELARFCCYVNTNLSKEAGRLHRWSGPLLQRRYQAIPVSAEEEAQVGRLRYLLAHGCKEGLVAMLRDWPGPHCADALTTGETCAGIWFDRHQEWLGRVRGEEKPPHGFCTNHQLALAPLPCWRHLPRLEVQRRIAMMVAEIESEAAARHRADGGKPLGRAGILRQDPQDRPASSSRSPAPLVHAASKCARREIRIVYYLFVAAFRAAAERLKLGCRDAVFPDGCFPPPLPFCRSG